MDTRRKVVLVSVIIVICLIVLGAIYVAYNVYETMRVKTEILSLEERWQVSSATYDEIEHETNITIKYLGENSVDLQSLHTECLSSSGFKYFEDITYRSRDISFFSKGATQTINTRYYVYNVTIFWNLHYGDDSFYATFDVLSVDMFPH